MALRFSVQGGDAVRRVREPLETEGLFVGVHAGTLEEAETAPEGQLAA